MKQQESNFWTELPYYLIAANVLVVFFIFGGTDMLSDTGIGLIFLSPIVGCVTVITGIWITGIYFKGKRDYPKFLGPVLILVGFGMIGLFLFIMVTLFSSATI